MKLAVDCRMIGSGGIGTYFESVLPFLLKQYDCLLIGQENQLSKYINEIPEENLVICDIDTFSIKELLFFPKSITKRINKCDAYYTPYCNIPSGIKIPIFSTIHDVVFLDIKLSGKIGTIARKLLYQYAVFKSKEIFTVSNFSLERIKTHLKIDKKPLTVTYNSVPAWFTNEIPVVEKENYIIFVGNIKKHKGLHTLIPAFKIAKEQGLNAKLLIIGNASNFRTGDDSIITEIKNLPEDYIEFTGKVSDDQLKTYYAKSRILVQPSLYEGFGMPPLEALTLGTNVIISDIPVFKEIYKDFPVTYFRTGDYQDLANKILEIYNKKGPSQLPEIYSFEKTSKIIIDSINKIHNK